MGKCILIWTFLLSTSLSAVIGLILFLQNSNDAWLDHKLSSLATTAVTELPIEVQNWHDRGKYIEINGFKMFYILIDVRQRRGILTKSSKIDDPGNTTLILIHGYPTSSFDYHRAVDKHLIPQLDENIGKVA